MSPESIDYLGTAERILSEAERLLSNGHTELAARESYTAAFHAARAIIFEKTGESPRTHSGTRALLSKLLHEGLEVDSRFLTFLAKGFEQRNDMEYGPRTEVGADAAKEAIETAEQFVTSARRLLGR